MKRIMAGTLVVWGACVGLPGNVFSLGLSTPFGLVTVENLQPGETYNTRELVNLPLSSTNKSETALDLRIDVVVPDSVRYPNMASAGFEPVPDAGWVSVTAPEITAPPGQTVATDVVIRVPDDDRYLGKRYQVQLMSRMVTKGPLAAGLNSTLRFTIAPRRAGPEEIAQRKKVETFKNVSFTLLPSRVDPGPIEPGGEILIPLKLANTSDETFTFFFSSVRPENVGLLGGSEVLAAPTDWLDAPRKGLKVGANQVKKFSVRVRVPKTADRRGGRYLAVLKVELPGLTTVLNQAVRLYLTVKPQEVK